MSITVFIADDHDIVRDGLRLILESHSDMTVVGEADNGRTAVQKIAQLCPNIAIMDIAMPQMNGIEATHQIRDVCPLTRVIILSMYSTKEHIIRALDAGARGYLLKESAGSQVVEAVRTVHKGRLYLCKKIPGQIRDEIREHKNKIVTPLTLLSFREREILQLVVEGKSSAEIADMLNLSPKTVETYRSRLMQKLNITNIPDLVKFAIQHGLTPLR